ncbi:efflux RND transporter permease subunit [Maridesulfovibrio ferrireducens]|uniref:efflux RND transporter permease subunit n=1 Tax=Maridesulfovibrio ferrireducens TaxID=246191 RepID=UPI001A283329|nr:efflux RND transporter permease subunit [Maridesulfovibrio ferrireducens]MBI9112605.1 efflux RND transporter permease subunit [Maridesulfovibrio ferrireducens]
MAENSKKPTGPISWMAGNSVASNLLMIILLIGGLVMAFNIKQEVFPEFSTDTVTVSVSYHGASPEEVEQGIVLAIEEAVIGLDGVKEVTSSASEGRGSVTIEAIEGYDLQQLTQDIKSEVDRITSFPEEAEDPSVKESSHKRQVLALMVYGDVNPLTLRKVAENLREDLISDPGITQVDLSEVSDLQVTIEIPQDKLRAYNLTLTDVAKTLNDASVELPGGGIKTGSGEVLVRFKERKDFAREFARVPIVTGSDGTQVRLEDIADVKEDFQDDDNITSYNGVPAVRINVFRVGTQTPITVSEAVHAKLKTFNRSLPKSVHVDVRNDSSDVFKQRMDLLLKNGLMGLALVFILLALFLEPRLAFWVSMGIPISFLGSMLILSPADASINMISMFAFIISLGIVVDDAIVVGENVYTMRQQGMTWHKAAYEGAKRIAMPVTFSVLTNIVAFMPLFFIPGIMGKIFKIIPLVVCSVFAVSLVESLFVLPAHLAHGGEGQPGRIMAFVLRNQQKISKGLMVFIEKVYRPFLDRAIAWKYLTVALGFACLLIAFAYIKSGRLGFTMFPKIESNYAYLTVDLPYGTAKEVTMEVQKKALKAAAIVTNENGGDKLVRGVYSKIGGAGRGSSSGSHVLKIQVFLTDADIRPISTDQYTKKWRNELGPIAGAESVLFESDRGGPGSGGSLEIELSHTDIGVLERAASDLAAALSTYPKVKDIDDGYSPGKRQLDFELLPEGRSLGLTPQGVASQMRAAYYGAEVLRQQRGRNEVKVMVRLPISERVSEYNLEEMIIRTPKGTDVPLREVVKIKGGRSYTSINRRDGRRVVSVSADVTPRKETAQIIQSVVKEFLPQLKADYPGLGFSLEGKQADMQESTDSLISGLLMAMMCIYALLAIPFKSYFQPIIIMICIPFGIVGAVIGHILLGYSLSLMSLFGIVALSGVVVNDSLVFIDYVNKMRMKGHCAYDAVLEAGTARFRPILLTTLTTFGGLAPMILETSRQARFLIPMAISLGFGILFATGITLILVPSFYMIFEDIRRGIRKLFRLPPIVGTMDGVIENVPVTQCEHKPE